MTRPIRIVHPRDPFPLRDSHGCTWDDPAPGKRTLPPVSRRVLNALNPPSLDADEKSVEFIGFIAIAVTLIGCCAIIMGAFS